MLTGLPLILVFLLTMAILLVLLIKFKFSAIVGLLIASIFLGIASFMPLPEVLGAISTGFGNTMKSLGLVIAFGGIFGLMLTESGGTEELAKAMLRKFGKKYDMLAITLTGFIISIPVYFGSAYIMLAPLINSISKLTRKKIAGYSTSLFVGLIITHSIVPPTPGPVAVSGIVGSNIGFVILYGALVGLIGTLVCGWLLGNVIGQKVGKVYEDTGTDTEEKTEAELLARNYNNPSAGMVIALILFPAALIMFGAISTILLPDGGLKTVLAFVGDGTIALFIAMLFTGYVLRKYLKEQTIMQYIDTFSDKMGNVILVVAAGGCFGQVISATGLADILVDYFSGNNMPILVLAFLLTLILRASIGSGTVAMLTSSSIVGSAAVTMGYSPVIVTLAICAGAIGLCIPTDGGFWIAAKLNDLDMSTALKAISLPTTLASVLIFILVLVLNMFTGILPGL